MGTGKVLTEEDFEEKAESEDTSETPPQKEVIKGKEKEEPKKEEVSAGEEEPQPRPSEDKKYKHATWDETEKARVEAEKKMTEKSMEASELRKRLEKYERPKEEPATLQDRIDRMTDDTVERINTLPQESPTRQKDANRMWAKLQSDIYDLKRDEERRTEEQSRSLWKRVYDAATKEGLKSEEEIDFVISKFSRTDASLSVDERISSAVDNAKTSISKLREGFVEKTKEKEKEDLKVLGRGSSRREKSEKEEEPPKTMSQQLAELNEKRRLKKDDLFR